MAKLLNKFEIGCDPEFVVIDAAGKLVNVEKLGIAGPAGYDHGGRCAELRPEKARGSFTLTKRLQAIMRNYKPLEQFKSQRWRAGAYVNKLSLGGHIHFNLTRELLPTGALAALDHLTIMLEHLEIMPKAECLVRRQHTHYGKWGEIRTDTPDGHVEYRTMASWLFSPWIAFLALTTAKLAVCSPRISSEALKGKTSRADLIKFLELFQGKDVNVDRLLARLNRSDKWLNIEPDADIKEAWEQPLG